MPMTAIALERREMYLTHISHRTENNVSISQSTQSKNQLKLKKSSTVLECVKLIYLNITFIKPLTVQPCNVKIKKIINVLY